MKEIPLKQWLFEQAKRESRQPDSVYYRLTQGRYPSLKLRRVNRRVVFVQIKP